MNANLESANAHDMAVINWYITLRTNLGDDKGWTVTRHRDTITVAHRDTRLSIDFDIDGNGEPDITVWERVWNPSRGYYTYSPVMDGHWETTGKDWPWLRTAIEKTLDLFY